MPHEVCRVVCRGGLSWGGVCVWCVGVLCVCVFALHTRFGIGMFSALLWRHTHGRTEALQTVQRGLRALRESEGLKEVLVMSHMQYDFSDTEPKYFRAPTHQTSPCIIYRKVTADFSMDFSKAQSYGGSKNI